MCHFCVLIYQALGKNFFCPEIPENSCLIQLIFTFVIFMSALVLASLIKTWGVCVYVCVCMNKTSVGCFLSYYKTSM
jgi:hypothetical protein